MANTQKDLIIFLEYYANKSSVLDGSSKRNPTNSYQNFYQSSQSLSGIDSAVASGIEYEYLAFDADGFSSIEAASMSDLLVSIANTAEIWDLSDTAIGGDRLVIASMYIQNIGQEAMHSGSAQLVSRFIGTIDSLSMTDSTVDWVVSPAISKQKAQVPTKRIASSLMGRFVTT